MKRPSLIGSLTQSLVELELDDEADKVPGTRLLTALYHHYLVDFFDDTSTYLLVILSASALFTVKRIDCKSSNRDFFYLT